MYKGDLYHEDYGDVGGRQGTLEIELGLADKRIRALELALMAMCREPHRVGTGWVWFPNHGFYRHEAPELFEYLDSLPPGPRARLLP